MKGKEYKRNGKVGKGKSTKRERVRRENRWKGVRRI